MTTIRRVGSAETGELVEVEVEDDQGFPVVVDETDGDVVEAEAS